MCVIAAVKLPRDPHTGKPTTDAKWRLAKIRDRTYVAKFTVKRDSVGENDSSQLFLVDQDTDWTEGVSVQEDRFIGVVNSALNNTTDKKDNGKKSISDDVSKNGKILRKALKQNTVKDAAKVIVDNRIDGNTFITDGNTLIEIEIYIPEEVKIKYAPIAKEKGKKLEDVIPYDKYVVKFRTVDNDEFLIVKTNIGSMLKNAGYNKKDGENYISSVKRQKYAYDTIVNSVFHPVDLIIQLSRLGRDEIDKNPYYRPVRLKDIAINKDKPDGDQIFSTAVVQLDPSGTIFLRPIECDVDDISINKLADKKRRTNLVVLPAHIPLFESFKNFIKF